MLFIRVCFSISHDSGPGCALNGGGLFAHGVDDPHIRRVPQGNNAPRVGPTQVSVVSSGLVQRKQKGSSF